MDTGIVDVVKFPEKYHAAINSQSQIGWRHIFMGRLSQEWLQIYEDTYKKPSSHDETQRSKYIDGYVWGANLAEILIRQMIILWEQRNKKIHGENDDDAENLQKEN